MPDANLISVMIPCFNSAQTLGRALASLHNQTYTKWEALIVDDGSSDDPGRIVAQFRDPRMRFIPLGSHQGRSQARQRAIEEARGEFLTMLDADDWILPDKFARQIEILRKNSEVALVSTDLYMAGKDGKLKGILRYGSGVHQPLSSPRTLPVAHAPIMVRMSAIRGQAYDTLLTHSEDLDFFLPTLMKYAFFILDQPLYVYQFEGNRSLGTALAQLSAHRTIFGKYLSTHLITASKRIAATYPKAFVTVVLFTVGLLDRAMTRKFSTPNELERSTYAGALASLSSGSAEPMPIVIDPTGA